MMAPTKIFKALCEKNKVPYVTPLDENLDSTGIIQKLSEQCQGFEENIESETESEITISEPERESEAEENPKEEEQF